MGSAKDKFRDFAIAFWKTSKKREVFFVRSISGH
jgi:hypothetical protein